MKTSILTRKELYEQVWSKPMVTLAKEYCLSDNGLRKICKKHNIPIPPMGHWQKIQFGKKVSRIPLPKQANEEEIKINVQDEKLKASENPKRSIIAERIRSNKSLFFNVSDRLSVPDNIILKTKENIESKKVSDSYSPVKGTVQTDRGFISIMVSPENITRSLRILDNLIKNFKTLGYKVEINDEGLNVVAYDDKMTIYVREKSNASETIDKYGWKNRDLIANGKLAIKINRIGTFEFVDTNKRLVEDQIENILIKIENEFQRIFEMRQQWKVEQQKQEEIRKIAEAKQKLKDDELGRFIQFYNAAHRWKKYMILKEYFEFIDNQSNKSSENKVWLEWASKKLDWYNPILEIDDELLSDIDRDTLTIKKKYY